jgi:pyridoxal phosphate enzyme (YggS family)
MNDQPIDLQERLAANLDRVRSNIARAAERSGRSSAEVALIAVSKTVPIEAVKIAYNLGVSDFGENRVQDALPKIAEFRPADVRWHMIGHLQSNKVARVVGAFDMVQSVDSLHLAQALNRYAEKQGIRMPVLLQVNISGEHSKDGIPPADAPLLARKLAALAAIDVRGLMTIAPLVRDPEEVRPVFRGLRDLLERLRKELPECAWQHLSMGMTDDYHIAIEEGSTIVRIGRAIFGGRSYKGVS